MAIAFPRPRVSRKARSSLHYGHFYRWPWLTELRAEDLFLPSARMSASMQEQLASEASENTSQ